MHYNPKIYLLFVDIKYMHCDYMNIIYIINFEISYFYQECGEYCTI